MNRFGRRSKALVWILASGLASCGAGTAGIVAGASGGDGSTTTVEPTTLTLQSIDGVQSGQVTLRIGLQTDKDQAIELVGVEFSLDGVGGSFHEAHPLDDASTGGPDFPNEILPGQPISGSQLAATPGIDFRSFVWNAAFDLDGLRLDPGVRLDFPLSGNAVLRATLRNLDTGQRLQVSTNEFVLDQRLVQTFAGGGVGDGTEPGKACFLEARGIAVDAAGVLFVADTGNHRVRRIEPGAGRVLTIAGNGFSGFEGGLVPARLTSLNAPSAVAVDAKGLVYFTESVADLGGLVRRLDPRTGLISIVVDPTFLVRPLEMPAAIAFDAAGGLWIADAEAGQVWRVDVATVPVTGAGIRVIDGFQQPTDLAVASRGGVDVVYVVESAAARVRRILGTSVEPEAFVGVDSGIDPTSDGAIGHLATELRLFAPTGVAADARHLFVADRGPEPGPGEPREAFVLAIDLTNDTLVNVVQGELLRSPAGIALDKEGTLFVIDGAGEGQVEAAVEVLLAIHRPESPAGSATESMAGGDSSQEESQVVDGTSAEQETDGVEQNQGTS